MSVSPRIWNLFDAIVRDTWGEYVSKETDRQKQIKRRIDTLKSERTNATRLYSLGKLTDSAYQELSAKIESELADAGAEVSTLRSAEDRIDHCAVACRDMLIDPASFWQKSDLRAKQRFQKVVFPGGLPYLAGEFGTAPTAIVFKLLREPIDDLSNMAPRTGGLANNSIHF